MTELERLRRDGRAIVDAAIAGVEPSRCVEQALTRDPVGVQRVHVISAGKCAVAMAEAARRALGSRIVAGVIVAPMPIDRPPFESFVGGHPLPTSGSEVAGRRALRLAESAQPGDVLLCLLSGGASALMAAPAAGVLLRDKIDLTDRLMPAGADITALNTVRKHLSDVKGGGLARRSVVGCRTLAISDVLGDDPGVIGSGPGVPDASTFGDALAVLDRFGGRSSYPAHVVDRLEAGAQGTLPETLKPSDREAALTTIDIVASRVGAMSSAEKEATRLGYRVIRLDRPVDGEAAAAARAYADYVGRILRAPSGPICVVSSGETTVRVTGPGKGGRNQEFALSMVGELARRPSDAVLMSAGTDGVDGPTSAAGAIVDSTTLERARTRGLDPDSFQNQNDSYSFFDTLGDLIVTGPTGTNVGDLQILVTGTVEAM